MQFIQSRQNQVVREILSLTDKKNRKKHRCFIVEGFRFVQEALSSGMYVEKICVTSDAANKFQKEMKTLTNPDIKCYEMPAGLFNQLAETDTPQGVLALVHMPDYPLGTLYRKGFRGLILDGVQDPGNAGTMIRSAHALGFDAVAAAKGTVDLFNSKVLRSTMGSIFHIPVVDDLSYDEIAVFCSGHGLPLVTSCLEGSKQLHETDLTGEFFIVVGNEGKGVSEQIQKHAAYSVHIPMPGGAESFNAAVAASIIMYESNRQMYVKGCCKPANE